MKSVILLDSGENTGKVEAEEQSQFVRFVLERMRLPLEGMWEEDGSLSVENKIRLRNILSTYGYQIIDDGDGQLQIYCDGKIIGEWKRSQYTLKKDLKQKDPKKKLYLEMLIDCWSIHDNQEE